ncbi:MAG: GNAT family N-acetyltransferase [Pirellulales bacterium]
MQIGTLDHRTIREADARAIGELLIAIWPKPGRTVETRTAEILGQWKNYRGPESEFPRSFLVRDNGRVIAHAQADPRMVHTVAGDLKVLALCRVCTDPAVRGKNLGQAVVKAAFGLVDNGPYPFALFQTRQTVRPFYEKLGAAAVGNRFFNSLGDDPTANPFWDPVIMRYPSTGDWPEGEIDIRGPGW